MYKTQIVKKIAILGIIGGVLSFTQVFSFDLESEISTFFLEYYDKGVNSDYMNDVYNPEFSRDPFGDSLKLLEDQSMQRKVAGAEAVSNNLSRENCAIDSEKVWAILYYFSPDFRDEILRSVKSKSDDFSSYNFELNENKVLKYCREYYFCVNYDQNDVDGNGNDRITSQTAKAVMENCKDTFLQAYEVGSKNQERIQSLETIQLGKDKYANASTDESPYDIIVDMKNIGTVLFEDIEEPITPIFFNVPAFYKSAKKLQDRQNGEDESNSNASVGNSNQGNGGNSNGEGGSAGGNGGTTPKGEADLGGGIEEQKYVENNGGNNGGSVTTVGADVYDYLVEGLNSWRLADQSNSLFRGKMCGGTEDEDLIDEDNTASTRARGQRGSQDPGQGKAVSDEDYNSSFGYMQGAFDDYGDLPDDKKDETEKKSGNNNKSNPPASSDGLEQLAEEIKECWDTCEDLSRDQKATCRIMCSCGEWNSKVFDSEKNPGLGPIFTVRGCFVPGVNHPYSAGGTKMVSIEFGANEIHGVVDKLSREGKLGTWVKQHNFLDSSTKNMNFANLISFSFSIETKKLSNKKSEPSNQFKNIELKKDNENYQKVYHISNPLDDPVTRNYFRIVGSDNDIVGDYSAASNPDKNRDDLELLDTSMEMMVDANESADALRYISFSTSMGLWLDQQGETRNEIMTVLEDMKGYADSLYAKKTN